MKKYPTFDPNDFIQNAQREYDRLQLFQRLLRECAPLNEMYHGKATEIADGIQPWIDALEITLKK